MICSFADINFEIKNKYSYTEKICEDYLTNAHPDAVIEISDVEIKNALSAEPQFDAEYHESICIYRKICRMMPNYDGYVFHSSAVAVNGASYLFTAPSGTGKSTHARLWKKSPDLNAVIINDDKPLLRFVNGTLTAFGTPWCGKEGVNTNISAPVAGICFLSRGKENRIEKISSSDAILPFFDQIMRPQDENEADKMLSLIKKTVHAVPLYKMTCLPDENAALTAYRKMKNK